MGQPPISKSFQKQTWHYMRSDRTAYCGQSYSTVDKTRSLIKFQGSSMRVYSRSWPGIPGIQQALQAIREDLDFCADNTTRSRLEKRLCTGCLREVFRVLGFKDRDLVVFLIGGRNKGV